MKRTAITVALLLAVARPSLAEPITFGFTSTLSSVYDPTGLFTSTFGLGSGDPLAGTYTFDSTAADQNPDPLFGVYSSSGWPFGFTLTSGYSTSGIDTWIRAVPTCPEDPFGFCPDPIYSVSSTFSTGSLTGRISLVLAETAFPGVIATDDLPLEPLDPARFTFGRFVNISLEDGNGAVASGRANLNTLTAVEVPEASALAAIVVGVAMFGAAAPLRRASRLRRTRAGASASEVNTPRV